MELMAIITALILVQTLFFGFEVGKARGKYSIKAPAVSGNEQFERYYRVHQNTLEQIVIFLPSFCNKMSFASINRFISWDGCSG